MRQIRIFKFDFYGWYILDANSLQHMDNITSLAAYGIRTQGLNAFFFAVTRLANPVFAFVMVALTSLLLYFRYAKRGLSLWFLLANAIGSLGINPLVKSIIQRQRPEKAMRPVIEKTYSFPRAMPLLL